ncbi:UDP-N-acetylmuramoyl-tripeptide--D-alanyl-D-alanine ligase [Rossellomorea aquimaris]|uniref:UDP-N-acetylmuramoyl-tripeptide--D-alanyl-D- alanine ligase n=1 Tax=Rossellomorea aquimaris TaxID=189382 RepID=UPI0007D093B5|nr:UDP-N-acetylmuramoyl-tripeptide--D-alanyl-D-alanine ligase [Rossellomorea aquimaris]
MKAIPLKDVRKLVNGTVIQGSEDMIIQDAIVFHQHKLVKANSLVFIDKRKTISQKKLNKVIQHQCAIVTDLHPEGISNIENLPIITVQNVRKALMDFAHYYRGLLSIPVVAITGTCGKTTTREMLTHIMEESHTVRSTTRNNNQPHKSFQYLMSIDENVEAGVFETGLGGPNDLHYHCQIYQPTIGIITNIGIYHLDRCKTFEGYLAAKAEMLEGLQNKGTLLLNGDDDNIKKINLDHYKGKIHYFSIHKDSPCKASTIFFTKEGTNFTLHFQGKRYSVFLPEFGEHQVYNALAAIRAAHEMGIEIEQSIRKLRSFKNIERHLQIIKGIQGATIVDDTWNSNPTSLKEAFKVLKVLARGKKRVAVIGDVDKLGDYSEMVHRDIGDTVVECGVDTLITYGENARYVADQVITKSKNTKAYAFTSIEQVYETVLLNLDPDTYVLVKCRKTNKALLEMKDKLIQSKDGGEGI